MVRAFNEQVCHRRSVGSKPSTPSQWATFGQWAKHTQDTPAGSNSVAWSLLDAAPMLVVDGDLYQFGVFGGKSLEWLQPAFPEAFVWGFDSFDGLPEEQSGVPAIRGWAAGSYDASRFGVTPEALQARLGGNERAQFIKGFYNESLTSSLLTRYRRAMRPAVYVDIDCDIYISSHQALDWMFKHQLIVVGTLVGYDDWWVMPCAKMKNGANRESGDYTGGVGGADSTLVNGVDSQAQGVDSRTDGYVYQHGGEALAHLQMTRKYGVRFRCVCGPCSYSSTPPQWYDWRPYFVVEALGVPQEEASAGFTMQPDEQLLWMRSNRQCLNQNL